MPPEILLGPHKRTWTTIYLPAAGRNTDYVSNLSKLENVLDEIEGAYNNPIVMIRGDANASIPVRPPNSRDILFTYFCERSGLHPILTNHKTYHHFTGNRSSDSAIDVLLHKNSCADTSEDIKTIICSNTDSRVDSKHDMIVSEFKLPFLGTKPSPTVQKPPEIDNTKHRIKLSEEGILEYRNLLSPRLPNIQNNWKDPAPPVSFSVLLQCMNEALTAAAKSTNKVIDLSKELPPKRELKPPDVTAAEKAKKAAQCPYQSPENFV